MTRTNYWILTFCFALSLSSCGGKGGTPTSSADLDHPSFLWEVTKGDAQAWLFGTMHFSDPEVTHLGLEVHQVLDAADAIFTEVEETPTSGALVSQAGAMPKGKSLASVVSPELLARLHSYLVSRKLPATSLDHLRPWMVGLQIGQLDAIPYMAHGVKLDVQLMHRAQQDGKEFGAIETIEEQLRALSFGSMEEQVHMLSISLDKLIKEQAENVNSVATLRKLYLAGNADALWAFAMSETDLDDPIQNAWLNAILQERNTRMAQRIHARLLQHPDKATVFAFGTLHFVGPNSVGEHLRSLGYIVNRVEHIVPQEL